MPLAQRNKFTPEPESGGVAANHSFEFAGFTAVMPSSPAFTLTQVPLLCAKAVAGAPLSCVPPKIRFGSDPDSETETNCVIGPKVAFKLSKLLLRPHVPVVNPMTQSKAR